MNPSTPKYNVLGIGTPIVDLLIKASIKDVNALPGLSKGSESVDIDTFNDILKTFGTPSLVSAGGGDANTIKGLSKLGESCCFAGKIGEDASGKIFDDALKNAGVLTRLTLSKRPTAQVLCLLTPDNERTMRSYLGAGMEMDASDLSPSLFAGIKLLHIEGYLADREGLLERSMKLAKEAGAQISFDVSSHEIVSKYKKLMIDLISNFVDVLFANEEEAKNLTGLDPEKACHWLKDICPLAVVKMGPQGCWVTNKEDCYHQEAVIPKTIIDTTGAGDLFASGFLYGYLKGADIRTCAYYGAVVAAYTIETLGTDMSDTTWKTILSKIT